jgi:hypothetical protein
MADEKILALIDRPHSSLDYHWALRIPGKPLPKPLELSGYQHAKIVGDVYVALKAAGLLEYWQSNPLKHRSLEEDAKALLSGYPNYMYFEIDRANQHKGAIASKASRYVKLKEVFHTIFVVPSIGRAEDVLDELPRDKGTKFLVTLADLICVNPLMKGYVSANRPAEMQRLEDILGVQLNVQSNGIPQDAGFS